jgi:hypothetical protein
MAELVLCDASLTKEEEAAMAKATALKDEGRLLFCRVLGRSVISVLSHPPLDLLTF